MFTRAKVGDHVKILRSSYPAVFSGEVAVVDCLHDDPTTHEPGYGVKFTKFWPQIVSNMKPPFETRILWFPIDAVQVMTEGEIAVWNEQQTRKKK